MVVDIPPFSDLFIWILLTRGRVSEKHMNDFHLLEELMSPNNNWKNYQDRLNGNLKVAPQLPHMGT